MEKILELSDEDPKEMNIMPRDILQYTMTDGYYRQREGGIVR